jgi:hypothetical protein
MNVRSARRLLGRSPDDSSALADSTGRQRWFAHPNCASEAGRQQRLSSRSMPDELLARPLDDMTREELAKTLASLESAILSGWNGLPDAVQDRAVDKPYLDSLVRSGQEPHRGLRYPVRVRAIGRHLDKLGGVPLMREVLHLAQTMTPRPILRNIEASWHGIGDWRG